MGVLSVGMMVCDIPISTVPDDILQRDSYSINPPFPTCGGDALNVAVGLSKLGIPASIVGRIGRDTNGDFILKKCKESGIDVSGVKVDEDHRTATTFALIDQRGERHFLSDVAIFNELVFDDIPHDLIKKADIVYFGSAMSLPGMDSGGIYKLFHEAHKIGKITVMDAALNTNDIGYDWMEKLNPALYETDVFLPSIQEASLMTGKTEILSIAKDFENFNMRAFGIKLGKRGCYITDFKSEQIVPCVEGVPVIDTSGAGDSFVAGFICGLSQGWDIFKCAEFANVVASLNVGAVGSTSGIPNFDKAIKFYQSWIKNQHKKFRKKATK